MKPVVIILSGGMDSVVLLYSLKKEGLDVHAVTVDYGQRHVKEIDAARLITLDLRVPHYVIDLSRNDGMFKGSSQTDGEVEVPHGHYTEESMKKTVVPNRNMIMLSMALGYAISIGAEKVYYGAHAGDYAIYPDCRPQFVDALNRAAKICHFYPLEIIAPFDLWTKAQICEEGGNMNVPFGRTWSCYEGQELHCGKCGTCVERKEAFNLSGVFDPTEYRE